MPSLPHEFVVAAFRNRPDMGLDLTNRLGVKLPKYTAISVADSNLSQVVPTEYRADIVLRLEKNGEVVASFVVEAQRDTVAVKKYSWPQYLAAERERSRAPTWVVVVASNERVAKWARKPIDVGGGVVRPVVVGPGDIPRVTTREEALRSAELAVLSLLAHWNEEGTDRMLRVTLEAIAHLGEASLDRAVLYFEYADVTIGPDL